MMLERLRLDGKVAIVTGAGRGLGRQMALALAEAGADVVCAARTLEQIERTANDIRALGRRAVAQPTDVRDSAACDALIRRAVDEFGRLDVMLSNAGIGDMRSAGRELWDIEDDAWREPKPTQHETVVSSDSPDVVGSLRAKRTFAEALRETSTRTSAAPAPWRAITSSASASACLQRVRTSSLISTPRGCGYSR